MNSRTKLFLLFLGFSLISIADGMSQRAAGNEGFTVHVGLEFSMLFQSEVLVSYEDTALDSTGTYEFNAESENSFRFGGYFRIALFRNHSLETGLYRLTRKYNSEVSLVSTGERLGSNTIRGVAYEIPLVWTISVPVSEGGKMSTGFGGVASFFASDFGVFDLEYNLDAFLRSKFLPGIKANVGFEHNFGREGGVYVGATFQHHFQSKAFLRMEYLEEARPKAIGLLELNASYFAAVVRYIFPMN